jgi:hypothetical protein
MSRHFSRVAWVVLRGPLACACAALLLMAPGIVGCPAPTNNNNDGNSGGSLVVLGYNELGMHCMNSDFSELMLLPPYNNLRAQVIRRGGDPQIVTSGVVVSYSVPGNTHSADKTNFWTYAQALLGVALAPNVGLTGNGLSGTMTPTGENDWVATGIPITPLLDTGVEDTYALATISVAQGGATMADTRAVVPVSWEINCDLCHNTPGISTATDILRKHDQRHGTTLESRKPVLCAACHADPALNAAGQAGIESLSQAMHGAHASRMSAIQLAVDCYACHPGVRTQCLRDVHFARGMTCKDCHTSMQAVAAPGRRPWVDEPRCDNCHNRAGYQYEQPGTLYRNSKGHSNVHCAACHGAPHAITPTVNAEDNVQAIALQGSAGPLSKCTICHTVTPEEAFFHRPGGD